MARKNDSLGRVCSGTLGSGWPGWGLCRAHEERGLRGGQATERSVEAGTAGGGGGRRGEWAVLLCGQEKVETL